MNEVLFSNDRIRITNSIIQINETISSVHHLTNIETYSYLPRKHIDGGILGTIILLLSIMLICLFGIGVFNGLLLVLGIFILGYAIYSIIVIRNVYVCRLWFGYTFIDVLCYRSEINEIVLALKTAMA
jgi:hypothetical protein